MPNGAIIINFRYQLWRIYDENKPLLLFIGLNPSTGSGEEDDPTIRNLNLFFNNFNEKDNKKYGVPV